jgi:hypothetical protein
MSRHDAPYLVKRFATPIGRPDSPRRIAVEYQAYTLEDATRAAIAASAVYGAVWIDRRGQTATRRPK